MSQTTVSQSVHPFYRLVARTIDLCFWTPLAALLFVPLLLLVSHFTVGLFHGIQRFPLLTFIVTGALFLCALMAIDALIGFRYGNTPGKIMMGIHVTEANGTQLTLCRRFRRNIGVAAFGLGFNILFIGWILMLFNYFLVHIKGTTAYDTKMGFIVSKPNRIGVTNGIRCALVLVIALFLQQISLKLSNEIVNPAGWYIGINAIGEAARNSLSQ